MKGPRISSERISDEVVPCCPHCQSTGIGAARISVVDLVDAWKDLAERVPVDTEGYAWARGLTIDCPDCGHPCAVRIAWPRISLVAARTEADRRLLAGAEA
jgi:hypothetical protein